jgi:hypothetical protein
MDSTMCLKMRSKYLSKRGLPGAVGLIFFLCTLAAQAADNQLWGALLLGTNRPPATPAPAELVPYQKRLSQIFGYTSFQVLGKSTHSFTADSEQWLIPGKTFSVHSIVQPTSDANFQVDLQLFQDKKELVQTVAKLGPGSPLFIRGPLYGEGQLIIAIMVH